MADDEIRYATMTVKSIRGLEARTIAKWEADGWEVVSQTQGRLQTDITLRKPKKKTPRWLLFAGAGVVVALVGAIVVGSILEGGEGAPAANRSASPTAEATSTPDAAPESTPTGSADDVPPAPTTSPSVAPSEPSILTVENSPELVALLTGPTDGESVAAFARAHAGDVIQFDGAIAAMNNHDGYSTRYDILISYGDYSETQSFGGPNFQLRDVGISDLNLVGDVPDTIGIGDEVRITAEVGEYEPDTTLFLLEPVETEVR